MLEFRGRKYGCLPSQHSVAHSGLGQAPLMILPPSYGGSGQRERETGFEHASGNEEAKERQMKVVAFPIS